MHFSFEESAKYHFRERADSLMHDMHPHTLERMLLAFCEKMDYIVRNMLGEKGAIDYVAVQTCYLLRLVEYYRKRTACEDAAISFIHGVRAQVLRLPAVDVERIKDENFTIKVLCDYEVALAQTPFKLLWEKCKAEDYVDTVSEWVDFLVQHPECMKESEKDVNRLICEASELSSSLSQQLERLSKHGFTWNFEAMLNFVKHQLNISNQLTANQRLEEANGIVSNLGRLLRLTPEIQTWAESSREVEIRGVYDYGVVLRPRLWGEFRTIPEYMQMLKNWYGFLKENPDCEALYIDGYKNYLNDVRVFLEEVECRGCASAELVELKKDLEDAWSGLPFKVRVRRRMQGIKAIHRILIGKTRQIIKTP